MRAFVAASIRDGDMDGRAHDHCNALSMIEEMLREDEAVRSDRTIIWFDRAVCGVMLMAAAFVMNCKYSDGSCRTLFNSLAGITSIVAYRETNGECRTLGGYTE